MSGVELETLPRANDPLPLTLLVVPVADLGGVARHVMDLVAHGIPGWRVAVLCPAGPLAQSLRTLGSIVVADRFGPEAGLAVSLATLRGTVRRLAPKVVHTHLAYADIVAALALGTLPTGSRVTLVSTEHGIAPTGLYHRSRGRADVMALVHRLRSRAYSRIVAVSQSTRGLLRSRWSVRCPIDVGYNGVDRPGSREVALPCGDEIRVTSLSRLAPEKNLEALLQAFALVHQQVPAAKLTVAGTGPARSSLVGLAEDLSIAQAVTFPGQAAAAEVLFSSDVVVQLSAWENCSYTLLDALSHGCGVVASPVGGNPELLPSRCLYGPADAPSVAAAVIAQARTLGLRPTLPVRWPTVSDMCGALAEVYRRAVR